MEKFEKTYKRIKDKLNKSGRGPQKWEFFEKMDEVLGRRPDVAPISSFESSDSRLHTEDGDGVGSINEIEHCSEDISEQVGTPTTSGTMPLQSRKCKRSAGVPEWYVQYRKDFQAAEERKERRHEELMKQKQLDREERQKFRGELLSLLENISNNKS